MAATPTEITLHRESRTLAVRFDDGSCFDLPSEYLRVYSPSAETRAMDDAGEPVVGKEGVNIAGIEPVGSYAVRIVFDDGHDTGIYSWETLFDLGRNRQDNWEAYLARRRVFEERRAASAANGSASLRIKVLYFERLAERLGLDGEELELAGQGTDVSALLTELITRDSSLEPLLAEERLKITVNKRFAAPDAPLRDGDEVALIPVRPLS